MPVVYLCWSLVVMASVGYDHVMWLVGMDSDAQLRLVNRGIHCKTLTFCPLKSKTHCWLIYNQTFNEAKTQFMLNVFCNSEGFCPICVLLLSSPNHPLSHFLSLSLPSCPPPAPRLGCGKAILSASVCCSLVGIDIEKIDECFDMESVRQTVLSLRHFSPTPKSEAGGVKQTCIGMENQELVNHHRRSAFVTN